jgi:hypothetical protein
MPNHSQLPSLVALEADPQATQAERCLIRQAAERKDLSLEVVRQLRLEQRVLPVQPGRSLIAIIQMEPPSHHRELRRQGLRLLGQLVRRELRLDDVVGSPRQLDGERAQSVGSAVLITQLLGGDTVTLPTTYVQESVELAYAITAHRAQGATVDTAHLLVTDQLTRALLYVGMTRGRQSNCAYVATHHSSSDLHEPHPEQTMQDVLEAVLNDPGVEQSAHEVMRQKLDNATRLDRMIPIHEHLCRLDAKKRYQPAIAASGLDPADQAALQASPAYGPLIAELRRAENADLNVADVLRRAINQSALTSANDLAAVIHHRVERLVSRAMRKADRRQRRCLPRHPSHPRQRPHSG